MKNKSFFVLFTAAACLLTGCSELTPENFQKHKLKPEDFFDFNTTSRIKVDLDYGEYGAYTLVSIFNEDPSDNENRNEARPVFKAFTDKNGQIVSSFEMPAAIQDSVYLYTSAIGTTQLVKAAVTDSTIRYRYERLQYSTEDIRTRVIEWPYFGYDNGNIHAILNWYSGQFHGTIGDHNQLIPGKCKVDSGTLPSITSAFWNGSSTRPQTLDNSASITNTDINITTVKDSVKIYFTFLTENTKHLNAIGYYCYPKGNRPEDFGTMQKYIIFPNTSVSGNVPYTDVSFFSTYYHKDAPVSKMTTVQLLYVKWDGNGGYTFSQYFPKETVIGFFILKDSWTPSWANSFVINNSNFFYTDKEKNIDSKVHFIRKDAAELVVYGAEDGDDSSFDDILFTMQSSPSDGISYSTEMIPDVPATPDPDISDYGDYNPDYSSNNEIYRTYCYEDLWPVKGDYDMNDVVIDHCSKIKFDIYNHVTEIVDEFTVCNRTLSAQVADAFAVVIPETQRGSMTLPQGAIDEKETGAIILFGDTQNFLGQTVQIVRNLNGLNLSSEEIITDLDPFIIPQIDFDDYLRDNRREVHMPKKKGTKKLDASLLGMAQEAYFVDKDGKHPFAITIPLSARNGEYIIPGEMHQIESEYEDFDKWVNSSGKNYKDWYKNYRYAK